MTVRFLLAFSTSLLAACSSAPRPEPPPLAASPASERDGAPNPIVAFYNGEPLTWRAVAEKMLELDLRTAVDQYARWRIVEDRRKALAIVHTPEELRRRAQAYAKQTRKQMGEEAYTAQMAREGATEEAWVAHLAGSRFLEDLLTMDKILRYNAILEDTLEIDRMIFVEEGEARKFLEKARAKGFDLAAEEVTRGERKPSVGRIPRETFTRNDPPTNPVLDEWILAELLKLKPGEFTEVEHSRSNLHYVVLLRNLRKGRNVSYDEAKAEVMAGILSDPPSAPDYRRWLDREIARCKIEYGDRKTVSGKGK